MGFRCKDGAFGNHPGDSFGADAFSKPHYYSIIGNFAAPAMLGFGRSTMTRAEFIQRLVLNSMCDDFENVDQVILRDVAEVAGKCGLTVERPEVVQNLRVLVEAGLAKAYDLSRGTGDPFSTKLDGMPPLDVPEEDFRTYFYPTKKGMEFHESDGTWWPLDDDDLLRSDWNPPRD